MTTDFNYPQYPYPVGVTQEEQFVLTLARDHRTTWEHKPESYWLAALMGEVGELASSLMGEYEHPPETELRQISAICLNWLQRLENGTMFLQDIFKED